MSERDRFEKFRGSEAYIKGLSSLLQHSNKLKQFEFNDALDDFIANTWQAALASQEPVGLVYAGQDGYGASLKQGLEHGAKLYTSQQPDLTEKVKEHVKFSLDLLVINAGLKNKIDALEAKLEVASKALEFECGNRCNAENNPCNAREAIKQLGGE
jgi:hypothetical protein